MFGFISSALSSLSSREKQRDVSGQETESSFPETKVTDLLLVDAHGRGASVTSALRKLTGGVVDGGFDEDGDSAHLDNSAYESALSRALTAFGPDSDQSLAAAAALAQKLSRDGESARACAAWRTTAEMFSRCKGPSNTKTLDVLYSYAIALLQAGDVTDAEQAFAMLVTHLNERCGSSHPLTLRSKAGRAEALQVNKLRVYFQLEPTSSCTTLSRHGVAELGATCRGDCALPGCPRECRRPQ